MMRRFILFIVFATGATASAQEIPDIQELLQELAAVSAQAAPAELTPADISTDTDLDAQSAELDVELPAATPLGEGENTGFLLTADDRVEFHARNIDVSEAFLQLRQLTRRNVIVAHDVDLRFTGDLYDVTVDQAVDIIAQAVGLIVRREAGIVYLEPAREGMRVYTLDHARAADLVTMIEPLLGGTGFVSGTAASQTGIIPTAESAGSDDYAQSEVLVVRADPDVLAIIDQIIAVVDARPQQVLVEATILSTKLEDTQAFGVNLTKLAASDFLDAGATSPGGTGLTIPDQDSTTITEGFGVFETDVADGLGSGGLQVAFLRGRVGAFLKALQTMVESEVLANPKVIAINKQRGEVLLGRRDGYRTSTTTQTVTTEEIEFLETGTRLLFRPFITSDGYVRLEIHPEDSEGGLNDQGLPFELTTEVTTNVMVRSGDTVVLGGLFRERTRVIETKVPLIGDIPLLGWLFRSTEESLVREEIIVLLTPHILDADGALQTLSYGDADEQEPELLAKAIRRARASETSETRLRGLVRQHLMRDDR